MKILPSITPDETPFAHPAQSTTSIVRRALTGLNGQVLPVQPDENETPNNIRAQFYAIAKTMGITNLHTA